MCIKLFFNTTFKPAHDTIIVDIIYEFLNIPYEY